MGAIEDVRRQLLESDLVQNPLSRTRNAHDIIDECLAPLVAELEAMDAECARRGEVMTWWSAELEAGWEAVECIETIIRLCPCGKLGAVTLSQANDGSWRIDLGFDRRVFRGKTLLDALRAADTATEQEKRDV